MLKSYGIQYKIKILLNQSFALVLLRKSYLVMNWTFGFVKTNFLLHRLKCGSGWTKFSAVPGCDVLASKWLTWIKSLSWSVQTISLVFLSSQVGMVLLEIEPICLRLSRSPVAAIEKAIETVSFRLESNEKQEKGYTL